MACSHAAIVPAVNMDISNFHGPQGPCTLTIGTVLVWKSTWSPQVGLGFFRRIGEGIVRCYYSVPNTT